MFDSLDFERCYRAVESRDARFDGWFITAVKTTGIYCRPSCPTPVRPKRENVRFYPTAAAAQLAGFRACKRCRPDASPGSPEWNVRGDLVGRAMRLIAEGIVDRDGVTGLAHRLAVSQRHLHRLLLNELGAGPLAIARAQRAQTARTLIETTDLPFTDVAFAAGFDSVRQFNDTVREVFALTPTALRLAGRRRGQLTPSLRSPCLIACGNSTTGLAPWIWNTGGSSELIWPLAPNFTGPKNVTTSSLASSSRTLSRSSEPAFSIAIWNSAPHSAAEACP